MYYQLPLEQIVRHRNRPSQGDFAHEALEVRPLRVRCLAGRPVRQPVMAVRAEAPLRDLLGLGESLSALTGGSAQHSMRLSRYLP